MAIEVVVSPQRMITGDGVILMVISSSTWTLVLFLQDNLQHLFNNPIPTTSERQAMPKASSKPTVRLWGCRKKEFGYVGKESCCAYWRKLRRQ